MALVKIVSYELTCEDDILVHLVALHSIYSSAVLTPLMFLFLPLSSARESQVISLQSAEAIAFSRLLKVPWSSC